MSIMMGRVSFKFAFAILASVISVIFIVEMFIPNFSLNFFNSLFAKNVSYTSPPHALVGCAAQFAGVESLSKVIKCVHSKVRLNERTNERTNEWINGWMNERMNEWISRSISLWISRSISLLVYIYVCLYLYFLSRSFRTFLLYILCLFKTFFAISLHLYPPISPYISLYLPISPFLYYHLYLYLYLYLSY